MQLITRVLFALGAIGLSAGAAEFHVSPGGSASGDGSMPRPWDLATALAHPAAVKPGDTIWLRGGTYRGSFVSKLAGSADKPIYVRQYPGERATLDGNGSNKPVLSIGTTDSRTASSDAWYWGFEITNSNTNRADSTFTTFCPPTRCHGIYTYKALRVRFINLVIHDNGLGMGVWIPAQEVDMYGNLIYHNGWEGTGVKPDGTKDRAHGHAIYTQNNTGQKKIRDNIIFNQFDNGIQVYTGGGSITSPSYIDNYLVEGNTSFNNGSVSSKVRDKNILVGGGLAAKNPVVIDNYTYHTPSLSLGENAFGYVPTAGWTGGLLRDNYFVGGRPVNLVNLQNSQVYNNFGYGSEYIGASAFPNNTFLKYSANPSLNQRPKGEKIFVRPNLYEPGRANVTIFNWDLEPSVDVNLAAAGLAEGQHFEVRDVQNFYGDPVAYGIYSASNPAVRIPMIGLTAVQPIGQPARTAYHTAPEFGAFIVLPRDPSGTPPPPVETKASAPVISPNGGTFNSAQSVTLTSATAGATIRYTTNGSAPGASSPVYTAPLTLSSCTLKAIALKSGLLDSDVSSASFVVNVNSAPVVSAGPDRSVALPNTASMAGSATDDGRPGPLTISWSKVSGPGTVAFSNAAAATTTAAFSAAGSYVLRLTASDGALSASDDAVVTVTAATPGDVTPPAISAIAASPTGTITWTTNESATSQVEYGTTTSYGQSTPVDGALKTAHSIALAGLAAGTTWHFRVKSADAAGNLAQSANQSLVIPASPPPPGGEPGQNGLALWLRADRGVTPGSTNGALFWDDQSPNRIRTLQTSIVNQPLIVPNALNGQTALRFDGMNDWMAFRVPINGLTGMTVFLVSSNTASQDGGANGAEYAPMVWRETSSWGAVHLSPFQSQLKFRFGTGEVNNLPGYARPASLGNAFSITTAMKSAGAESLWVGGAQVFSRQNARTALAGVSPDGYFGRGISGRTYFKGDIAEVIVYNRALTDAERTSVEAYLKSRYGL